MAPHPLSGHFSVETSARLIRYYRYAEERLMRMLGGWIALTPELPAKLLFGRHVWDCAQHADLWGRRLPELRSSAQQSEPPNDRFVAFANFLESVESPHQTGERLTGIYRVLKPHLIATYERHLVRANAIYEPPTRRILERCVEEERRHVAAGAIVLARVTRDGGSLTTLERWEGQLRAALADAGGVTGDVERAELAANPRATVPIEPDDLGGSRAEGWAGRDVVALESSFDPRVLEADLAEVVDAHGRALADGDMTRAQVLIAPSAASQVLAEYARLGRGFREYRVVGLARVGAYRLVKLALTGSTRAAVVVLQWRCATEGWRVVHAQLVRAETGA